jgi:type III secretion protein U
MKGGSDSSEKKWRATPRRWREARRQGEAAKSRELTAAAALVGWLAASWLMGDWAVRRIESLLNVSLVAVRGEASSDVYAQAFDAGRVLTEVVVALAIPAAVLGSAAAFLQVGPILALNRISADLNRLNPTAQLRNLFKPEGLIELLKMLVTVLALAWILTQLLEAITPQALALSDVRPGVGAHLLSVELRHFLAVATVVSVVVGALDLLYQRFSFERRLRMSREEVKQDRKAMEGDPRVKRRRRDLYRAWIEHSAKQAAAGATVVVVNPTHIAVAMAYDPTLHAAPVVSTKGEGPIAALIRAAAEEAQVPIVENIMLARSLHELVEIDDVVPEPLFGAVAEVISWANTLRTAAARAASVESD